MGILARDCSCFVDLSWGGTSRPRHQ
jgi:hypothetical protein